jgi:hypothetical protein
MVPVPSLILQAKGVFPVLLTNPRVVTEDDIIDMAREAAGSIDTIYLHWTAGHYGQIFDDYHFSIDGDGTIYAACRSLLEKKCHTWRRNSRSIGIALCGAYGARVTLPTCEIGAGVSALSRAEQVMPHIPHIVEYGPEPPLPLQTEVMARLVAILCRHLNLPIEPATVQTHCEAAIRDGYGPCSDDPELRWDLWFLPNADPSAAASGTPEEAKARERQALSVTVADAEEAARLVAELPITRGGDLVRGKARWYRAHTWLN